MIRSYEDEYCCRLVVFIGAILPDSVTLFEETLFDASLDEDLHLLLATPGGDAETALRIARQAQSRCKELTVIVPDQAKSAGTLLALAADHILMGPTSDLGPIDPQLRLTNGAWVAGKTIIDAVDKAEERIRTNPNTYPLHASLLTDITAHLVQQARDALDHAADQLVEALGITSNRPERDTGELVNKLKSELIDKTHSHAKTISAEAAISLGLPVSEMQSTGEQWRRIWFLWTKYVALNPREIYYGCRIFEGRMASIIWLPQS